MCNAREGLLSTKGGGLGGGGGGLGGGPAQTQSHVDHSLIGQTQDEASNGRHRHGDKQHMHAGNECPREAVFNASFGCHPNAMSALMKLATRACDATD